MVRWGRDFAWAIVLGLAVYVFGLVTSQTQLVSGAAALVVSVIVAVILTIVGARKPKRPPSPGPPVQPVLAPQPQPQPLVPSLPAPRKIATVGTKELVRLYNQGATDLQSKRLIAPYVGQWHDLRVVVVQGQDRGSFTEVEGTNLADDTLTILYFQPVAAWADTLGALLPGDQIRVQATFLTASKYQAFFDNCQQVGESLIEL